MSKPVAGELMASRSAWVMRGMSSPLEVLYSSKSAVGWGVFVPMPTFCCAQTLLTSSAAAPTAMRSTLFPIRPPPLWDIRAQNYYHRLRAPIRKTTDGATGGNYRQ
jgi:hypothetical protein